MGRDAGGIWVWRVMRVSMVEPCWTENVWSCAKHVLMMMALQKIGSMPRMIFAFSTWVTLQSFHGLGACGLDGSNCGAAVWIAALSRNLEVQSLNYRY